MLHILTVLNQIALILANFCAQAIFRVPFTNPFPTLEMTDFQIVSTLHVPKSVDLHRLTGSFGKFRSLFYLENIFQL